ncbi:uncharacterized protein LOC142220031 [Haematobia irritans]|uniref:uncharacterized protein LOC142220031 n=1 Tax=Haematobia irritans TaxID=7368 RepID=UPI003F4FC32A
MAQQSAAIENSEWLNGIAIKKEIFYDHEEIDFTTNADEMSEFQMEITSPKREYSYIGTLGMDNNPSSSIWEYNDVAFQKDIYDQQESDSDEEGYSDIDLDDNDEVLEDENDIDPYDPEWVEGPPNACHSFEFETPPNGLGLENKTIGTDPLFYFEKILGEADEFFDLLAYGTNKRAQQLMSHSNHQYPEITSQEMKNFMGLCLEMSDMKLCRLADYWKNQTFCGFMGFNDKMDLRRFYLITKIISFEKLEPYNKQSLPTGGQTSQFNSLLHFFNMRMDLIYSCGNKLVLNDPLIYWKGNLESSKNCTTKFRCNALKLHLLNDPSGLILKILLDVETKDRKFHVDNSRLLVEERLKIVLELLKEKLNKGHSLYSSKYYSSYALVNELAKLHTFYTGYLANTRYGNSRHLIFSNTLFQNCVSIRYADSIMMGKCRNRQNYMYFISSDCRDIEKNETKIEQELQPNVLRELDWHLRLSNNKSEYIKRFQISVHHDDITWSTNLTVFVFNLMVYNAYILYTMYSSQPYDKDQFFQHEAVSLEGYTKFRRNIIHYLLSAEAKASQSDTSSIPGHSNDMTAAVAEEFLNSTSSNNVDFQHLPLILPKRKGKFIKKKCQICKRVGMLTYTRVCCEQCPATPGLCETPCFEIWHKDIKKSDINLNSRLGDASYNMKSRKKKRSKVMMEQ